MTAQTRLGYGTQIQSYDYYTGTPLSQSDGPSSPTVYYTTASTALVGDNSYSAFTNPIQGSRYRFEASPTVGTFHYTSALADYRQYYFARPLTLAIRGLQYGRYGRDSDNGQLYPLYLGEETFLRGYGYGSFDPAGAECAASRLATGRNTQCPSRERLFGSRLAVFSTELRIPLFGVPEYGLLNVPFLPLTVSPFFDIAQSWTGGSCDPARVISCHSFTGSFADATYSRGFVASTGISARVNVLGYVILEGYAAHPFQRPGGPGWVYGVQLAPGW